MLDRFKMNFFRPVTFLCLARRKKFEEYDFKKLEKEIENQAIAKKSQEFGNRRFFAQEYLFWIYLPEILLMIEDLLSCRIDPSCFDAEFFLFAEKLKEEYPSMVFDARKPKSKGLLKIIEDIIQVGFMNIECDDLFRSYIQDDYELLLTYELPTYRDPIGNYKDYEVLKSTLILFSIATFVSYIFLSPTFYVMIQ